MIQLSICQKEYSLTITQIENGRILFCFEDKFIHRVKNLIFNSAEEALNALFPENQ